MEIEVNEDDEPLEGLYIEEIEGSTRRNIQSDLMVNNIPVIFKLDTGAECSIMSMRLTNELNAQVEPTSMLIRSFGGQQLETVGKCFLDTKINEIKGSTPFRVLCSSGKCETSAGFRILLEARANQCE